ncbi:hypothetical protein FHX73_112523 [Kitasatospora viridis]|uniref:Uncharacterized protein n=1 Tax=Kitasatospora viridis TaxID=281105 RepID=A0A561UH70_9ACTN|nr:hypothetical protein FHX73_112523 [Kitasatospora viridis]
MTSPHRALTVTALLPGGLLVTGCTSGAPRPA